MIPNGIVTLTTDFSLSDGYVGVMKGVILGINPQARLVDITHDIPPQNIDAGAFVLHNSYHYFPKGTIHLAIVDPGVGSERKIIAVSAADHFFIAPDNHLLKFIFFKNETLTVVEVLNRKYFRSNISRTFHGRDMMAPVAAHLSKGIPFETLGPITQNYDRGAVPKPEISFDNIIGRILHVDTFGNLITNIEEKYLVNKSFALKCGDIFLNKLSCTYQDVLIGEPLALLGSSGFLEICLRNGNAAEKYVLKTGDILKVIFR